MHSSDIKKLVELGANIEISSDTRLHPEDAIEIVTMAVKKGSHVTVHKSYHSEYLIKMVEIGGDKITITV